MKALLVAAALGTLAALPIAQAQSYPSKPVRLIIPFAAGGAADVPGRILAHRLTELFGQQVVIENRPGAGSTIGAEAAARAAPDGYTLFMISNTHFVSAALHKKLTYDSLNDFTPITQVTSAPLAPGRFSTTTVCLSATPRYWATTRVMVSVALPGPNGTMMVIGLLG